LLLDHGAGGDDQGYAQLVGAEAVVEIFQGLIQDVGLADIGEVGAGFIDDGVQAIEVQWCAAAIRLYHADTAGRCLGGRRQGRLGGALARLLFPVDNIIAGDLVLAGTHQRQLYLILHIFDVNSTARGHATFEGGRDQIGQPGYRFMNTAGGRCSTAFHREEGLGDRYRNFAGLKWHHGAVALDNPQLPRCRGGYTAADCCRFPGCGGCVGGGAALAGLCLHVFSGLLAPGLIFLGLPLLFLGYTSRVLKCHTPP